MAKLQAKLKIDFEAISGNGWMELSLGPGKYRQQAVQTTVVQQWTNGAYF